MLGRRVGLRLLSQRKKPWGDTPPWVKPSGEALPWTKAASSSTSELPQWAAALPQKTADAAPELPNEFVDEFGHIEDEEEQVIVGGRLRRKRDTALQVGKNAALLSSEMYQELRTSLRKELQEKASVDKSVTMNMVGALRDREFLLKKADGGSFAKHLIQHRQDLETLVDVLQRQVHKINEGFSLLDESVLSNTEAEGCVNQLEALLENLRNSLEFMNQIESFEKYQEVLEEICVSRFLNDGSVKELLKNVTRLRERLVEVDSEDIANSTWMQQGVLDDLEMKKLAGNLEEGDASKVSSQGLDAVKILLTPDEKLDALDLEYKRAVLGGLTKDLIDGVVGSRSSDTPDYIKTVVNVPVKRPPTMSSQPKVDSLGRAHACGKRKTSVARVMLKPGTGNITVNGRNYIEYFGPLLFGRLDICEPFLATETMGKFDVVARIRGGGFTGQKDALSLAIARALLKYDCTYSPVLRKYSLLTRDPRMVERKKAGQKKARKKFQWVKR